MLFSIVQLAKELIKKPSISPKDCGCQNIIIKRLKKNNFIIENIPSKNTKNLWAFHGKNGKTLAFSGHTDVVPPGNIQDWIYHPFKAKIKNNILYGRGSADMKGAIAAMIIAVEKFVKDFPNHPGRIAFLITSDEETKATNGTVKIIKKLISKKEKIEFCIIGEPSSENKICDTIKNGRRGSLNANIVILGIQGHTAYPNLALNPIHNSLPFLNELIKKKWDYGNKFFPPTNLQISNIHSGIGMYNIIPEKLEIKFNVRFNDKNTKKKIINKIKKMLIKYKLKYKIKFLSSSYPFLTKKNEFINKVSKIIKKNLGYKPYLSRSGGTSDGRFISKICPQIIELGLINQTIHKKNECVPLEDLRKLSSIYHIIIKKILLQKN